MLRPYVPRLVVDWLRHTPDDLVHEVEGSLAFVDISGFTKLTERLAKKGKVGAEEMSDLLNATFAGLLAEAYDEGAGLVKWGGDAVLLLFDGPDHALRAAQASHRMRATMRRIGKLETTAGHVTLRMSVGIHSGIFHFFLVGDPEHHRELLVSGPAASTTAVTEANADAGQIGLSEQTAERLVGRLVSATPEGRFILRGSPGLTPTGVLPAKDVSDLDLRVAVPAGLRGHVLAAQGDPEHRTIAVGFVQFSGTDAMLDRAGPQALARALDEVVRNVQDATATYGVTFFESDINRDGGKIMLTAGAPVSRGDEDERMLRAARLIIDRIGELPLRIGVNRGPVFSGDFGPPFRRTYSVKGDAINLAARVMGKASPGQLLATRAVVEQSSTLFATEALPPFMVKGKSEPVHALSIGPVAGARQQDFSRHPLTGREDELTRLNGLLEGVRGGRGAFFEIVGVAGIGKSRLAAELMGRAEDVVTTSIACEEYESATPYFAVRQLLNTLLGLASGTDEKTAHERLVQSVERDAPSLVDWVPLLGAVLDVPVLETDATRRLDPRFRKARLQEATTDFLSAILTSPALIVVDNAQHMDEASAELFERWARTADQRPWLVLVLQRESATGWGSRAEDFADRMTLSPLEPSAARDLVEVASQDHPLPPHVIDLVIDRAEGGPLFLLALVDSAQAGGSPDELPSSVEGLAASQIDQLPPAERSVLRHAAVLGLTFSEAQLRGVLADEALPTGREAMRRLGAFLKSEGHGRWRFAQTFLRDVAYEGLPYRRRRVLHGRVADLLESQSPDPLDEAELLSVHYLHAARYDKAWTYSVTAGDRAAAKNAYVEAARHFGRATSAARELPGLAPSALAEVEESLGDALFRVGTFAEARLAFGRARRGVEDPVHAADLLRKQAEVAQRVNQLSPALRTLTRALSLVEDRDDPPTLAERSRLEGFYAVVRSNQGRYREAEAWARRAEATAISAGDRRALADAYEALHGAYAMLGAEPDRPYGDLALRLYQELEDRAAESTALNNLAVQAYIDGRGPEALELLDRAEASATQAGDTLGAASSRYNIGDVLLHQARFAEARDLLAKLVPVLRSLGAEDFAAVSQGCLGVTLVATGDGEHGMQLLEQARGRLVDLGQAAEVVSTDALVVEALLALGRAPEAEALAAKAWSEAASLDAGYLQPTLQRLEGSALVDQDRFEEAGVVLDAALVSCATQGQIERGFILAELARVATHRGEAAEAERLAAESRQALDRLGHVGSQRYPRPA